MMFLDIHCSDDTPKPARPKPLPRHTGGVAGRVAAAGWRGAAIVAGSLLLSSCTMLANNRHVNQPMTPAFSAQVQAGRADVGGEHMVALALSGGGMRAAAFGFGAVLALSPGDGVSPDLFDDLTFISSVSGGSLTAAYAGLRGREVLTRFREEVLYQDLERDMRASLWSPVNLMRLLGGGLNDVHAVGATLERDIFRGATFADLYRRGKPEVWINASDLYNRTPFTFTPGMFALLCSDLSALPVSEAVAASMAVPVVFAPVVLKPHLESCTTPLPRWAERDATPTTARALTRAFGQAARNYRDPNAMRYIKLVDGGVTDNNGLSALLLNNANADTPYGPLTQREALRLKTLMFLVVDAGRPVGGDWGLDPLGPGVMALALAISDTATDSATRVATDAFLATLGQLRQRIVSYRCSLSAEAVRRIITPAPGWRCDDVEFLLGTVGFDDLDDASARRMRAMPTRLTLPRDDIDAAVQSGQRAMERHEAFRRYRALRASQVPVSAAR